MKSRSNPDNLLCSRFVTFKCLTVHYQGTSAARIHNTRITTSPAIPSVHQLLDSILDSPDLTVELSLLVGRHASSDNGPRDTTCAAKRSFGWDVNVWDVLCLWFINTKDTLCVVVSCLPYLRREGGDGEESQ